VEVVECRGAARLYVTDASEALCDLVTYCANERGVDKVDA
jgi:hypothetical protein